jgi:hypothetical protein
MNIAKSRRIPNAIWLLGQDVIGKEYLHFRGRYGKGKMMTVEVASRQGVASCKMKNKSVLSPFVFYRNRPYSVLKLLTGFIMAVLID